MSQGIPPQVQFWDDTIESDMSSDAAEEGQAPDASSTKPWPFFTRLYPELKIMIWTEAILAAEQSLEYELLFRAPQNGGAAAQAVQPEDGEKYRKRRMRSFGLLTPEALTAVHDVYVSLPYHDGVTTSQRMLHSTLCTWVCPKVDRFSWLMSDRTPSYIPAHQTGPDDTYPPIQEFLKYLPMPDTETHPMFPWPEDMGLYAKFREESLRIFQAVRHLDLTLPALSGQKKHDMEKCFAAFPRLETATISTRVPPLGAGQPSRPSVLGAIDRREWESYVAANDPVVKSWVWHELRRRYRGLRSVVPEEWGRPARTVGPHDGFYGPIHTHVMDSLSRATVFYDMSCEDWKRFFVLYDLLVKRGVEVNLLSGHNTNLMEY